MSNQAEVNYQDWGDASTEYDYQRAELDRGVMVGLGLSVLLIVSGVIATGTIWSFFNLGGLIIVLGGTFGATLITFSPQDMQIAWGSFKSVVYLRSIDPVQRINYLIALSKLVRKEGLLALEHEAVRQEDPFMRRVLSVIADGTPIDELKRVLANEIRSSAEGERRSILVISTLASYAPAMGFIGTLIGLVSLLESLNTPEKVGPAMAVALITTLYGAILANLMFQPVAGKLRVRSEQENLLRAITLEGAIGLAQQENSLVIEQRLQSLLPNDIY